MKTSTKLHLPVPKSRELGKLSFDLREAEFRRHMLCSCLCAVIARAHTRQSAAVSENASLAGGASDERIRRVHRHWWKLLHQGCRESRNSDGIKPRVNIACRQRMPDGNGGKINKLTRLLDLAFLKLSAFSRLLYFNPVEHPINKCKRNVGGSNLEHMRLLLIPLKKLLWET